jgi:phosphatidylserine/phosphatidylglycerophosphate/cardiolipin synthase-like enzyme
MPHRYRSALALCCGLLSLLIHVVPAAEFTPAHVAVYFSPHGGAKVMVIDSTTVLTGSFNFTKAVAEKNAENLLVMKDAPELVKAYEANVQAHAAHSHPYTRGSTVVSPTAASMAQASGEVHGNRHSKVDRVPGCKGYAGRHRCWTLQHLLRKPQWRQRP